MSLYIYPQYSMAVPRYRHHHRHYPYYGVQSSPREVQDALDLVSALVDGLTTSEAVIPRSRFAVDENGQFKFVFDVRDYKPEELKVSFKNIG